LDTDTDFRVRPDTNFRVHHPTLDTDTDFRVHPDTNFRVHPTTDASSPVNMPDASSPVQDTPHNRDSPRRFSLPAEEDVLGLEEDVLGFQSTDFPPGSLSSKCAGISRTVELDLFDLSEDTRFSEFMAELPPPLSVQDSLIHIVGCPRVCGIFGDKTRVYSYTHTITPSHTGLCDSGANLCMTNNPNFLVDVRPCEPFSISLATNDGNNSHTNVCSRRGLLPLPLIDGTSYYQTCFINPYASETFISPQAIIDSSAGSFDKWQMEGFLQGRPGVLSLYSPSGILKMVVCPHTSTFRFSVSPCTYYLNHF
jgi:hypothetical protein